MTSQVQSMKVTYEKHQREMSEKLERTVQENAEMLELQRAIEEERNRVDELQVGLGEIELERDALLGTICTMAHRCHNFYCSPCTQQR